jgi:hypothetical protein
VGYPAGNARTTSPSRRGGSADGRSDQPDDGTSVCPFRRATPVRARRALDGSRCIRDLERHVETDNGEIVALHNEPKIADLEILFLMATEFMISALEGSASILKLGLGAFCDEWKGTLKALADAHRNV